MLWFCALMFTNPANELIIPQLNKRLGAGRTGLAVSPGENSHFPEPQRVRYHTCHGVWDPPPPPTRGWTVTGNTALVAKFLGERLPGLGGQQAGRGEKDSGSSRDRGEAGKRQDGVAGLTLCPSQVGGAAAQWPSACFACRREGLGRPWGAAASQGRSDQDGPGVRPATRQPSLEATRGPKEPARPPPPACSTGSLTAGLNRSCLRAGQDWSSLWRSRPASSLCQVPIPAETPGGLHAAQAGLRPMSKGRLDLARGPDPWSCLQEHPAGACLPPPFTAPFPGLPAASLALRARLSSQPPRTSLGLPCASTASASGQRPACALCGMRCVHSGRCVNGRSQDQPPPRPAVQCRGQGHLWLGASRGSTARRPHPAPSSLEGSTCGTEGSANCAQPGALGWSGSARPQRPSSSPPHPEAAAQRSQAPPPPRPGLFPPRNNDSNEGHLSP